MMEVQGVAWLLLISIASSALGGVLGMAGGIFIVPILTMFGNIEIHTAITASIVSVIACSCGGASTYLKSRLTNIRLALLLEVATTLGALTGSFFMGWISEKWLYIFFAIILIVSAQQMYSKRNVKTDSAPLKRSTWAKSLKLDSSYSEGAGDPIPYEVHRLPLGMFLMYGAGVTSALLGIGSGVLKIPAMDTALRLPLKVSSATSNFMIGVTAAASGVVYFFRGQIDLKIAGPVALGSVIGSLLGAKILVSSSSNKIRLFFVVLLVALSCQMLYKALGSSFLGGLL